MISADDSVRSGASCKLKHELRALMADSIPYLIFILILIVAIILAMGLWNMMRGGSNSRSQTLMRWRVIAQFIAVIAMVAALYFFGRG